MTEDIGQKKGGGGDCRVEKLNDKEWTMEMKERRTEGKRGGGRSITDGRCGGGAHPPPLGKDKNDSSPPPPPPGPARLGSSERKKISNPLPFHLNSFSQPSPTLNQAEKARLPSHFKATNTEQGRRSVIRRKMPFVSMAITKRRPSLPFPIIRRN
uniref:Uncharacterized protein n=1 Tax=Globodera rostochiensis TaxID=31243 RepID=A0A914H481_GLORO